MSQRIRSISYPPGGAAPPPSATIARVTEGTRWPEARAVQGLVAAPHALASQAGLATLKRGGNALDAAIAAATTVAVVYPHMNGVGGDSFWRIYHPALLARERFVQADLGATLEELARGGIDTFYCGALGRRIALGAAAAGSPLTVEDLAAHRAEWVKPLRVAYRNGEAASLPPPTQGFAALAILSMLEGFDIGSLPEADYVHLVVEATKLAFEDRDRYLTDPTFERVPVEHCLDPARLAEGRRRISRRAARQARGAALEGDTIAIVAADAAATP